MNTAQLALVVAAITGGAGVVQAIVQGWLTSRSSRVIARQDAIKANLRLLETLHEQLSLMGQAANEYVFEMFQPEFYSEQTWKDVRQPLLRQLTTAQGGVYYSAHTLRPGSDTKSAVLAAAGIAVNVGRQEKPEVINAEWSSQNWKIRDAIEAVGAERRQLHDELLAVTHNAFSRAARRLTSWIRRR